MVREGWIKPAQDYSRFKAQLDKIPVDKLPEDKKFNPLSINPYILFKAFPQSQRYTQEELIRAMNLLLRCNQRLISSSLDESLVLQQTLIEIVGSTKQAARVS
jgi:DNA polymerase III delta subunit